MSLQSIRDAFIQSKKTEISACVRSHGRKLRSLYLHTNLVEKPAKSQGPIYDAPPTPEEQRFLDENDLSQHKYFREETLPYPLATLTPEPSPNLQPPSTSLRAPSPLTPAPDVVAKPNATDSGKPAIVSPSVGSLTPSTASLPATHSPPRSPNASPSLENQIAQNPTPRASLERPRQPVSGTANGDLTNVPRIPVPSVVDALAKASQPSSSSEHRTHARTIHLPSKEEQLKLAKDADRAREAVRLRDRDEAAMGLTVNVPVNDGASSPSSTAGAYSTSTPKPVHHSPDTSPEADFYPGNHTDLQGETSGTRMSSSKDTSFPDMSRDPVEFSFPSTSPEAQLRSENAQASNSTPSFSSLAANQSPDAKVNNTSKAASRDDTSAGKPISTEPSDLIMKDTPVSRPNEASAINTPSANIKSARKGADIGDVVGLADRNVQTPSTRHRAGTMQSPAGPVSGRMTTRVASGALRQKSVSEILGETPRPSQDHQAVTPVSKRPTSTHASSSGAESRDRGKLSTVVFSKDRDLASTKALNTDIDGYLALQGASLDPEKDYLKPLFLHQAWAPPRATPLPELLSSARKTVTTSDIYANMREVVDYRILRRIYQLQNANKWSLRQQRKYRDPTPPPSHWDFLLDEMKWMRTDFREERRWKMALARNMAEWCSLYVSASEDVRQHLRVKVKSRTASEPKKIIADSFDETPELVHSGSSGSSVLSEDEPAPVTLTVAPTALFSLGYDDVIFPIDHTPAADELLSEVPMYNPKRLERPSNSTLPLPSNDTLVPVSKFVTCKLVPKMNGVTKKRSRFDYETDEDESSPAMKKAKSSDPSPFLSPARRSSPKVELPPEEQDIALFNPLNKHIRDRLHATHAFRPPSEFPMPTTAFFEARPPSQWIWDEDHRLRNCVRKYSYNWSLISMELQAQCQPSLFISGPERRTPWECFERWYHLEGLPGDMNRTTYFRTYQNRLDSANQAIAAQAAASQQALPNPQTPHQFAMRRRTNSQPVRVDRRRDTRHVNMIDAIRKLARKRETTIHRQQESMKAAALRKAHTEVTPVRPGPVHKVKEFCQMRATHDTSQAEKQERYRRQVAQAEQQRVNAAMQQRAGQIPSQQQGISVAQQRAALNATQGAGASGPMIPNGQQRIPSNGLQNGPMGGIGMAGVTQAQALQLQAMQQQQRLPPQANAENLRMAIQQRQFQMQQVPGQNPSLAAAHLSPSNANMQQNQQQMLAVLQRAAAANGSATGMIGGVSGMGGVSSASSTAVSGNPAMSSQQPGQISSGHTPTFIHLQHQIQQQFPHIPIEQVRSMASERLKGQIRNLSQSALHAAAGSASGMQGQNLAQQHLGLQSQNHQQQMLAAAFAAQNGIGANTNGLGVVNRGNGGSPTQMYANMAAAHQHAVRMGSGSPAGMGAGGAVQMPDSRSQTPNGMARSLSGAGGSPIMGGNGMGR